MLYLVVLGTIMGSLYSSKHIVTPTLTMGITVHRVVRFNGLEGHEKLS